MTIAERCVTLDEFLKLTERTPALEYEGGVVRQKAMPKNRHAALQGFLWGLFNALSGEGRRWRVFVEQRCTFGGRSVVPDVTVVRAERLPIGLDGEMLDDFLAAPDIAVEVLSPKQSISRTLRRCSWYVENGVAVSLMLDPDDKTIWLCKPGTGAVAIRGSAAIQIADVLPGFELTAQELFDSLKVRASQS